MFRSAATLVVGLVLHTACNNEAKTNNGSPATGDTIATQTADTTPVTPPGGDRDEKGCITSAGYRWSVMKDTCIRIFEAGIKMEAKDPSLDKTFAAYIVFSKDRVRVEIFLPTQKKAVIIRRKVEGTGEPTEWASGPLTLIYRDGAYSLDDEGKLLYQSAAGN
ncbi:MAG: hypothetical protein ACT4OJ_15120 [Bacteroidota bacterium]